MRLPECLDSVLNYRLVLLVAPCGCGKTACLKRWSARWQEDSQWKIAWVSLREGEGPNPPEKFLESLENAVGLTVNEETPATSQDIVLEDRMVGLINHLASSAKNVVLILDNYHWISSPPVHEVVQLLLDYLPPQVHVMIASRSEPPLALPRLRVRRQLLELGPDDLIKG